MSIVLLASALVLLALPLVARSWGRRLSPRDWARLSVAALLGGVVAFEGALGLIGSPTLLKAVGVPGLAVACQRLLGELAPGGSTVGWSALLLAVVLPAALVTAWRRASTAAGQMHIEPWLGDHATRDDVTLVVLPTDAPLAYGVGRPSPQVVISRGVMDTLEPDQLDAVIRHELAHLRHHHPTILIAIDALDRVLPILRPSTASLRTALERWADEDAAASSPEARVAVHDALLHVAATLTNEPAIAAFTSVATLVDRLDALESPAPSPGWAQRASAHAAIGGVGVISATAFGAWIVEAHMMLSMAGICHM